jgi:hypothetical protein
MKTRRTMQTPSAPPSRFERIVKWVAGVGAIVSLLLGLVQVAKLTQDAGERMARVDELARLAKLQSDRGESAAAWAELDQAAALTDAAGPLESWLWGLDQRRRALREQREDIAMQWLRDARLGPDDTFSRLAERVVPALERGLESTSTRRRADILAHLGWAQFLKSRDSEPSIDPARDYANALALDAANPYAHAYWGHWILWRHGDLGDASRHFDAGLASGRARDYVRRIQISALRGDHTTAGAVALISVANTMRAGGEVIDPGTRDALKTAYYIVDHDPQGKALVLAAVPAMEQAETIRQLGYDDVPMRAALAWMLEAAGRRADALPVWEAVRNTPGIGSQWEARADTEIKRIRRATGAER